MIKESNMAIFSLLLGFIVVFCDIAKILPDIYLMIIAFIGIVIAVISLILSLINKKKFKARHDKYIFAIIISIISLVFNMFLFVSLILFGIIK